MTLKKRNERLRVIEVARGWIVSVGGIARIGSDHRGGEKRIWNVIMSKITIEKSD